MKQVLCETKQLINPHLSIYAITTYYIDGTQETHHSPSGPITIPMRIDLDPLKLEPSLEPIKKNNDVLDIVVGTVVVMVLLALYCYLVSH